MTKERVSIFIDGSNFYHNVKKILKIDERINYQKLINVLVGHRELINVFYYVASLDAKVNLKKYKNHEKFLDILRKIPNFNVVLCALKKLKIDNEYVYIIKGDDVKLSNNLLMGAVKNIYDTAIVISGDEDFVDSINIVRKEYKKKVENVYIRSSSSYKLRRACDSSLNMSKIISKIVDRKK